MEQDNIGSEVPSGGRKRSLSADEGDVTKQELVYEIEDTSFDENRIYTLQDNQTTSRSWIDNFTACISSFEGYVTSLQHLQNLIQDFEIATHSYFIVQRTKRDFGKEPDLKKLPGSIRWQDTQDGAHPRLRCDGVPFIILGTRTLDCHHGPDRDKRRKHKRAAVSQLKTPETQPEREHDYSVKEWLCIKASKKLNCPAKIYVRHILKFPEYECVGAVKEKGHRHNIGVRLQQDLARRGDMVVQHQYHVQLPRGHTNHAIGEVADSVLPIDRHLSAFIQHKVMEDRNITTKEMQDLLRTYVETSPHLFRGKPPPPHTNTRYWPSLKQIRNTMMLAVVRMRQDVNQGQLETEETVNQHTWPHITTSVQINTDESVRRVQCLTREVEALAATCRNSEVLQHVALDLARLKDLLQGHE